MSDKLYEFRIPVSWSMTGVVYVQATSLDNAIAAAGNVDIPDGEYMDGSWDIDQNFAEDLNESIIKKIEEDKRPLDHIIKNSFNMIG